MDPTDHEYLDKNVSSVELCNIIDTSYLIP